ncbi:MAG: TraB/GumN family protein, partial [Sphingomonas sp.]|nr:TraB/GumN family protein [Sphingomonas sp.]
MRRWGGIAALAALALAAGCARAPTIEAKPALFVVRDADTTIWLFGTIHLLPQGVAWRTQATEQAIADADLLVTEIPDADPKAANAVLEALMRNAAPDPILDRVPSADRAALLRSLDAGATWAAVTSGTTANLTGASAIGGTFFALGANGTLLT